MSGLSWWSKHAADDKWVRARKEIGRSHGPKRLQKLGKWRMAFQHLLIEFQIRRMSEEGAPTPGTLGADSPCRSAGVAPSPLPLPGATVIVRKRPQLLRTEGSPPPPSCLSCRSCPRPSLPSRSWCLWCQTLRPAFLFHQVSLSCPDTLPNP